MTRLNSERFLESGLSILAESGGAGLTITALCKWLGVTKGSFYHHFRSLAEYVDALLRYWEEDRNYRPIELSRRAPNDVQRVEALTHWAVALPHETESALRAWGNSNPHVAAVQARVDEVRVSRVREVLESLGVETPAADVLAQMGICLLIGFQHQERPLDPEQLRRMFAEVNTAIYREAGLDPAAPPLHAAE